MTTPRQPAPGHILIVDDDEQYADSVSEVLARAGYASHAVTSGEAAIDFVRQERPVAVLLDVVLPGASGYEICRELRDEAGPDLPIVFVSGERKEAADRVAGLLVGGDDYIVKPFDPDELIVRVRRLVSRSARMARTGPRPDGLDQLTNRERETLSLLAQGLSTDEISDELLISSKTVATHIQHILAKLDVHSRTQAVALAYEAGLVRQT